MACRSILLAAAVAIPLAASAQSDHPLVGSWAVEYPGGMRNDNGVVTPVTAKGKITFAVAGDSLVATLVQEAVEGGPPARPPVRLATKTTSADVTFVQHSEAKLHMNGEETTRTAITTWRFTVTGDVLGGSLERAIEGVEISMGGPQPLKGTRIKA